MLNMTKLQGVFMRNKSLTSRVIKIFIMTMIFLLLLLFGTSYVFYQKSKQDFKVKKEYAVNTCVQTVKERLNKAEVQLIDLVFNTLDEADLGSSNDLARYWAKNRINTAIKNKLSINSDVDCIFVKKENAFIMKGYNVLSPSLSRKHIMAYLRKDEPMETFKTRDGHWKIVKIEEEAFFYLAYEMSGFIVGALIRVSLFDDVLNLALDQDIDRYSYKDGDGDIYIYVPKAAEQTAETADHERNRLANERIVIKSIIPNSDIIFIGNFEIRVLQLFLNSIYIMLIGIVLIFMAMLLVLKRIVSHSVINPMKKLLSGMHYVAAGRFDYQVMEDSGSIEFNELNKSFNRMVKEIFDLRISKYEQQIKNSERKIKLLRMQIKPHFYLNAITTIRSMTYQNRLEDIRFYLDALSVHIRYMLKVDSSEVKLSEELSHIENYLKMQEIKFPNSVSYYIGCNKDLQNKEIGHLLLFTLIENAFKFAMNLYDTLILLIQCEAVEEKDFIGYRVIIEDNGRGFPKGQLEKFRIGNEVEEKQDGKHVGLSNIKKTLELQYGRKDLLRLSNTEPHGARVELWIPDEKNTVPEGGSYETIDC